MRRTGLLVPWALLMSLAGVYVSFVLLLKHVGADDKNGLLASFCESETDDSISCDKVLDSKWSAIRAFEFGPFRLPALPVALYGLAYFSAMTIWLVAIGRPSYSRRYWQLLPILVNFIGVLGSCLFIWVMATQIETWCRLCTISHAANFLMLPAMVLLWPRKPSCEHAKLPQTKIIPTAKPQNVAPEKVAPTGAFCSHCGRLYDRQAQPESATTSGSPVDVPSPESAEFEPSRPLGAIPASDSSRREVKSRPGSAAHPTPRTLGIAALAVVAVLVGQLHFHNALVNKKMFDSVNSAMQEVVQDTQQLYGMYVNNKKHEFPTLEDDPVRQASGELPPVSAEMVVFSDFQCPHCRAFDQYLIQKVLPRFQGGMKVTFKHFPADQGCNEKIKKSLHPQACEAAAAAEAAMILGGNDAFWKAHDLLFASQEKLKDYDYSAFAGKLGLDPETFNKTRSDPATMERIKKDVALALEAEVSATPSLFLSGRRVPRLAVRQDRFWDFVAKQYDMLLKEVLKKKQAQKDPKDVKQNEPAQEPQFVPEQQPEPQATTRPAGYKKLTLTPGNPNP